MAYKIAIDAGHGLSTAGKRCMKKIDPTETREWTLNSMVADTVCNLLQEAGQTVIRLDDPTGAVDIPLKQRTDKANAANADILVSIHHNAGIAGGTGGGCVVLRQKGLKETSESYKLQQIIYKNEIAATGLRGNRSNPTPDQNLHMLREADITAVLIECGFMDSKTDTPIILTPEFSKKAGIGIYNGICEYLGIDGKVETGTGDEYMVKTIDMLINGEPVKASSINYKDENYIRLKDICRLLDVSCIWDDEKKMPVINK